MIRTMFWYIKKKCLKSFRNEFICTERVIISVLPRKQKKKKKKKKHVILTSKGRSRPTILEFRIFSNVFLSNKTLFIIRILI